MSDAYYAKGMEIWKSPVKTEKGDGTTSISIGFQCATATEIVGDEGAQAIAELLTIADGSQARIAALEAENEMLRVGIRQAQDAMRRCEHDGGFDREIGPIGCRLGDKCVCFGVFPILTRTLEAKP